MGGSVMNGSLMEALGWSIGDAILFALGVGATVFMSAMLFGWRYVREDCRSWMLERAARKANNEVRERRSA